MTMSRKTLGRSWERPLAVTIHAVQVTVSTDMRDELWNELSTQKERIQSLRIETNLAWLAGHILK